MAISKHHRAVIAKWDEDFPDWWKGADVMSDAWDDDWVALILERKLAAADYFGRPYPDEEDVLRDEMRGLA